MNLNGQTRESGIETPQGGAERREELRQSQHLLVFCAVAGHNDLPGGVSRFRAEVFDLSRGGIGLRVDTSREGISCEHLRGRNLRLEFALPGFERALSVRGEVRWCRRETNRRSDDVLVGVRFFDPPPALLDAVADILSAGKGDQQFLWNLWESYNMTR